MRIEWSIDFASPDPQLRAAEVHDVDALDGALDAIAQDAPEPLVAELIGDGGARLGIGLGRPNSVLSFNASADPPYYVSAGNIGSPAGDVAFCLHGHWTEFPANALVGGDDAREAARTFFADGKRPDNVTWEAV